MQITDEQPLLVDDHRASRFLTISVSALRRDRAHAHLKIPFIRIGCSVRYRLEDLRKWIESQDVQPQAVQNGTQSEAPSLIKRSPGRPSKASLRASQIIQPSERVRGDA